MDRICLSASFDDAEDELAKAREADAGEIIAPGAVSKPKLFRVGLDLEISYQNNADLSGPVGVAMC